MDEFESLLNADLCVCRLSAITQRSSAVGGRTENLNPAQVQMFWGLEGRVRSGKGSINYAFSLPPQSAVKVLLINESNYIINLNLRALERFLCDSRPFLAIPKGFSQDVFNSISIFNFTSSWVSSCWKKGGEEEKRGWKISSHLRLAFNVNSPSSRDSLRLSRELDWVDLIITHLNDSSFACWIPRDILRSR